MFTSLKSKIKEETGSDINSTITTHQRLSTNNNRLQSRFSSTISVNSNSDDVGDISESGGGNAHGDFAESKKLCQLRSQCNDLTTKIDSLKQNLQELQEEKLRVDKTNEILLESVKVAQTQKDIYCEEQLKIQNQQRLEIDKLKKLLSYREQEAVDRLNATRQIQNQIEHLMHEVERLKPMEPLVEDLRDELERLRHAAQLDKNQLTTTLAAVEEENRHMKTRMQIVEAARLETLSTLNAEEKVKALVQERKLLEQHLEEAYLQLSDVKSSWSGQNLALETQLSRLSQQVAEETTEKRKALKARDDGNEKIKKVEFELIMLQDEIKKRDNKIKLLETEVSEANQALAECRDENEQQILFERNRASQFENELKELKMRIESAEERSTEYAANAEQVAQLLRQQNIDQKEQLKEALNQLEQEREEKLTTLLRSAEISQSEELLKKELRIERHEANELQKQNQKLEAQLQILRLENQNRQTMLETLKTQVQTSAQQVKNMEDLQQQISEKNKVIKVLSQRLADLKKTFQKEFRSIQMLDSTNEQTGTLALINLDCGGNSTNNNKLTSNGLIMDEVNFKYLKHVIVKFLTSREVEARHLIRAVSTLLHLTTEEEKLLHDTLNWKMSWFGSKPNHGSGQRAFSIPPPS